MDEVQFTHNGEQYRLARTRVIDSMDGVPPGPISIHAVEVDGTWFPVKQAFSQAMQIPRSSFISTRAQELLRKLGFPLWDTDLDGPVPAQQSRPRSIVPPTGVRMTALSLAVTFAAAHPDEFTQDSLISLAERLEVWLNDARAA